jgi:hypothetical protein
MSKEAASDASEEVSVKGNAGKTAVCLCVIKKFRHNKKIQVFFPDWTIRYVV